MRPCFSSSPMKFHTDFMKILISRFAHDIYEYIQLQIAFEITVGTSTLAHLNKTNYLRGLKRFSDFNTIVLMSSDFHFFIIIFLTTFLASSRNSRALYPNGHMPILATSGTTYGGFH